MEEESSYILEREGCSEEQWAQYNEMLDRKRSHFATLSQAQQFLIIENATTHHKFLKQKYPSIKHFEVLLWHLMCGSTPDKQQIRRYDYPDGEITEIINNELKMESSEVAISQD